MFAPPSAPRVPRETSRRTSLSSRDRCPPLTPEHQVAGTDAGFYRLTDRAGRGFTRLAAWLGTCGGLFPCDAAVGRLARFELEIHHAPDETVLCPGTRTAGTDVTRCSIADTPAPPFEVIAAGAYGLAPMAMLLQREALLGRAIVLRAVASFLRDSAARDTDALRAALESESGASLERYWSAWVAGAGEPSLPYLTAETRALAGGDVEVTVTQSASGDRVYPCVVELALRGATRTVLTQVEFPIAATSRIARVTAPLGEAPLEVTIDPDHRVADSPIPPGARGAGHRSCTPLLF